LDEYVILVYVILGNLLPKEFPLFQEKHPVIKTRSVNMGQSGGNQSILLSFPFLNSLSSARI